MELDSIGKWSFIIGIAIAILAAFITTIETSTILLTLFVLGLIVGALNIEKKNTTEFLVSVIALLLVGSLGALAVGQLTLPIKYLQAALNNFTVLVGASALVVSIETIIVTEKK